MTKARDFVVIGAGPAGLAAGIEARALGLDVLLLDEQTAPGGQIYRGIERAVSIGHAVRLGADYAAGAALVERFRRSGAAYVPGATVWEIDRDRRVTFSAGGRVKEVSARRLLLATGALERSVPIPGWTLPGVVTAGALQILLKTAAAVPAERPVLAGTGPLLLMIAAQLVEAGVPPAAILETAPPHRFLSALPYLPRALMVSAYLRKGARLLSCLRAARVPIWRGVTDLVANGDDRLREVSFRHGGQHHRLSPRLLALHEGVVPNIQAAMALGCAHVWDTSQLCFRPALDKWGDSSVEGVGVAGDGGGISGAVAAALAGRIAALRAAQALGHISLSDRDRRAAATFRRLHRDRGVRPLLEHLYAPTITPERIADATVICRCEEVTAGAVRAAVRVGALGPRQAKAFTRCGMGPCQGRLCGLAVTQIIAAARGVTPETVGYYSVRFPLKPVALAQLAAEPEQFPRADASGC